MTPASPGAQAGAAAGQAAGQAAGARAAATLARQAPASSAAPRGEGFFPTVVDAVTKVATTATAVTAASVEALAKPGPGTPVRPAPRPAPTGPAGTLAGAIGLLGELVGQVEDTAARMVSDEVGAPPAPRNRSVGGNILDAVTSEVGKAIQATAGVAGPRGADIGRTIAEGISTAVNVVAPPQLSLYDLLSTSLLLTEAQTMAEQYGAAAPAAPARGQTAPAAGAPAQQAAAPRPPANGSVVRTLPTVQAAPPEPADLAWLVNEALIEQARRHGMDLS